MHASTAVTTSSTAVLPDETKLIVGEILEVKLSTFNSNLVINELTYTIFSLVLKLVKVKIIPIFSRSWFHKLGAALTKALSP